MEIPTNNNKSEVAKKVEEYTATLIRKLASNNNRWASLGICGGLDKEALKIVLQNFKNKGWYAYYLERFDGVWIDIQIYSYHYQPSNRGYNHLCLY